MTNVWTKGIFIGFLLLFIIAMGGVGVAALFDKSVVEKTVKTVVKKVTEKVEEEQEAATEKTATGNTTNSNAGTTTSSTTNQTTSPTTGSGYTMADVQKHGSSNGCWVVYNGNIYQLGSYSSSHPGGSVGCGTDITSRINSSHNHSSSAMSLLQSYFLHALMSA